MNVGSVILMMTKRQVQADGKPLSEVCAAGMGDMHVCDTIRILQFRNYNKKLEHLSGQKAAP